MCYEATRIWPLEDIEIETPMGKAVTKNYFRAKVAFCPDPSGRFGYGGRRFEPLYLPRKKVGAYWAYRDEKDIDAGRVL